MRKLLLGVAAISLSGCSFLGIGGHSSQGYHSSGYSGYTAPTTRGCGPQHVALANGNCLSRFNIEGGIGKSYNVGGDIVTGDEATYVAANVPNVGFEDAYEDGIRYELGGSYALSPNRKVTAMAFLDEAESAGIQNFGTIDGEAFAGSMSDYKSTGVELGLRQYFNPTGAPLIRTVRPYVEGRVGAAYQDSIFMENATKGGLAIGTGTLAFSDSGWVPTAAGLVGLETPLTRYSTVGIESGIRWTGGRDGGSAFGPGKFEGLNNDGSRVSVPLMLRGRYRF